MGFQIIAVIVKGGVETTIEVSSRPVSPSEVLQILEEKKKVLEYDYVKEISKPNGLASQPKWVGDADKDATVVMREHFSNRAKAPASPGGVLQ